MPGAELMDGFEPVFKESPGAHVWFNWPNYLIEFTPQLFQRVQADAGRAIHCVSSQ